MSLGPVCIMVVVAASLAGEGEDKEEDRAAAMVLMERMEPLERARPAGAAVQRCYRSSRASPSHRGGEAMQTVGGAAVEAGFCWMESR